MTVDQVRAALRERIARGASLEELDMIVRMTRGLTERQRTELWAEAWRYDPRPATQRRVDAARSLFRRARRGRRGRPRTQTSHS